MGRATIKDVAKVAGVSLSTVNKALTGKKGISKELKEKVLDTVEKLGYKANHVAGSLARNAIRIGVIVPADWEDYYKDICDGIEYRAEELVDWKVESVTLKYAVKDGDGEKGAFECFEKMQSDGISAVIFCHDNYSTYEKALLFARENNIDVVCVGIGKLDKNANFSAVIEVDAYKCGRVAGEMLENCLSENSRVAVMVGSKSITPHKEKIKGFSDRIKEEGKLILSEEIETGDDEAYSKKMAEKLIEEKIDGIYVATGAVQGVCEAVASSGQKDKIKIIATDLSDNCRENMEKGVICATVYQNTFLQGVTAVNMLYKYFTSGKELKGKLLVPPILFTKESVFSQEQKGMFSTLVLKEE